MSEPQPLDEEEDIVHDLMEAPESPPQYQQERERGLQTANPFISEQYVIPANKKAQKVGKGGEYELAMDQDEMDEHFSNEAQRAAGEERELAEDGEEEDYIKDEGAINQEIMRTDGQAYQVNMDASKKELWRFMQKIDSEFKENYLKKCNIVKSKHSNQLN